MLRPKFFWQYMLTIPLVLLAGRTEGASLVEIHEVTNGIAIEPHLEIAEEPSSTPNLAISQAQGLNYQRLAQGSAHLGFTKKAHWFRFTYATRDSDIRQPILVFRYPLLDYLDVFIRTQGAWQHIETGAMRRFDVRSFPYRLINVRLPASKEPVEVYFRVASVTSFQAGARIYAEDAFQNSRAKEYVGLGFYYGALTIILAYNCAVYLFLRERVYLYYVAYLVSYMLFQMSLNGMTQQYIFPELPQLTKSVLLASAFLFAAFLYTFTETYLTFDYKSRLERLTRFLRYFTFSLLVLSLILPYQMSIIVVTIYCGIFSPILGLTIAISHTRQKRPGARYYLCGFSFFLFGAVVFALKTWNLIPINFFTEYAIQIGSIMEVLILSSGLAYRMNQTLNQNRDLAHSLDNKVKEGERLNKALAEEVAGREKLADELVKKSESLAEESRRSAELEKTLRLELESKVVLISDSVHHMNNPLNHIQSALSLIETEHQKHQNFLRILMSDQEQTAEFLEVQRTFMSYHKSIANAQDMVKNAVERASDSVRTLHILSGIDGYDRGAYRLSEIWEHLQRRTSLPIDLLFDRSIAHAREVRVIGHPAIYAQAMDHLLSFSWNVGNHSLNIRLSEQLKYNDYLEILISAQKEITNGEDFAKIQASIEYLIRAYSCKIERVDPQSFILCLPKAV